MHPRMSITGNDHIKTQRDRRRPLWREMAKQSVEFETVWVKQNACNLLYSEEDKDKRVLAVLRYTIFSLAIRVNDFVLTH